MYYVRLGYPLWKLDKHNWKRHDKFYPTSAQRKEVISLAFWNTRLWSLYIVIIVKEQTYKKINKRTEFSSYERRSTNNNHLWKKTTFILSNRFRQVNRYVLYAEHGRRLNYSDQNWKESHIELIKYNTGQLHWYRLVFGNVKVSEKRLGKV